MNQPKRMSDGIFRHASRGREPLASPNEGGSHVHYVGLKRAGIGCITSRRGPPTAPPTFYERLAYELGVNVTTARRLHLENKVQ